MNNLLSPRTVGYTTLVNCLDESLDEVIDLTICYKNPQESRLDSRTSIFGIV